MKRNLYNVWIEKGELFVQLTAEYTPQKIPRKGDLYPRKGLRTIKASKPAKAIRKYVRKCLPVFLYLDEDGAHESHDITHLPSQDLEKKHNLRCSQRELKKKFTNNWGKLIWRKI